MWQLKASPKFALAYRKPAIAGDVVNGVGAFALIKVVPIPPEVAILMYCSTPEKHAQGKIKCAHGWRNGKAISLCSHEHNLQCDRLNMTFRVLH